MISIKNVVDFDFDLVHPFIPFNRGFRSNAGNRGFYNVVVEVDGDEKMTVSIVTIILHCSLKL